VRSDANSAKSSNVNTLSSEGEVKKTAKSSNVNTLSSEGEVKKTVDANRAVRPTALQYPPVTVTAHVWHRNASRESKPSRRYPSTWSTVCISFEYISICLRPASIGERICELEPLTIIVPRSSHRTHSM
jgi:hypothetical protein